MSKLDPIRNVFGKLKLLKCTNRKKCVVGRVMYRIYKNGHPIFQVNSAMNHNIDDNNIRQPLINTSLHLQ